MALHPTAGEGRLRAIQKYALHHIRQGGVKVRPSRALFRLDGYANVQFTVSRKGRMVQLRIEDESLTYGHKLAMKDWLIESRYRPQFSDGRFIATERVRFSEVLTGDTNSVNGGVEVIEESGL
jgi:hypothetical protein